jgi:hypothetical protein
MSAFDSRGECQVCHCSFRTILLVTGWENDKEKFDEQLERLINQGASGHCHRSAEFIPRSACISPQLAE